MRKTIALLSAAAALAASAQPVSAAVPPIPAQASGATSDVDTTTTLLEYLKLIKAERREDIQLKVKPLDRRPSVAMPVCPDCRYHALDARS